MQRNFVRFGLRERGLWNGRCKCRKDFACEGFLYEARDNRMNMKLMLQYQGRDFVPLITLLQRERKNLFCRH